MSVRNVPLHYTGSGTTAGHAGHFECPANLKVINYKYLDAGHRKTGVSRLLFVSGMKSVKKRDILAGHWGVAMSRSMSRLK
jgi:hypothetical protein